MKGLINSSEYGHKSLDKAAARFSITYGSVSITSNTEYATVRIGSLQIENDITIYVVGTVILGDESSADIDKSIIYDLDLAAGVHTHGAAPDKIKYPGVTVNNFSGSMIKDNIFTSIRRY